MRVSLMTQRNRAAFSRSASRHSLHVCEPIIITLAWERLHNHLKPRENIYSRVPRSSLGALWGKWADKPLYGCHMQYKDLIRSTVSKYNDGFWENSVCKDWWELRWWHREACRPVSSSRCGQISAGLTENFLPRRWHKSPASLQPSTQSFNIILDMWRLCVRFAAYTQTESFQV